MGGGGLDGGGQTKLTPEGEQFLARYRAFRAVAEADVRRDLTEAFGREG
jgi:molybdenum-dependent DNA-binding transcriptional regulator ModE